MDRFTAVICTVLVVFSIFGCEKETDLRQPGQTGKWNIARSTTTQYYNGALVNSIQKVNLGTLDFRPDGTGTEINSIDTIPFTWNLLEDGVSINFCESNGFGYYCQVSSVIQMGFNQKQIWKSESAGFDTRTYYEFELDRLP